MSISTECYYSSLAAARLVSQAALFVFLALRWLLYPCDCWWPAATTTTASSSSDGAEASVRRAAAAQAVRDGLRVSTYGELAEAGDEAATCAVCLGELKRRDSVWELGNCSHVFHKTCLDRWLDHDERLTCPLCRRALLGASALPLPCASATPSAPSWPVERLLYLFGDDMLLPYSS